MTRMQNDRSSRNVDDNVADARLKQDEPEAEERRNPGATAGLVMGTYPIVLILGIIVAIAVMGMFQWWTPADPNAPASGNGSSAPTEQTTSSGLDSDASSSKSGNR